MLFNPCHYFYPTFELVNTNNVPLTLRPGMTIAQLLFARLSSPVNRTYKETGRYGAKNSNHFVPPREEKDSKKTLVNLPAGKAGKKVAKKTPNLPALPTGQAGGKAGKKK